MGVYKITLAEDAVADLEKIKKSGKKADFKKIQSILVEIEQNPRYGTGKPERLKHQDAEIWSRRLNKKDRIIYKIIEEKVVVIIFSLLSHYGDK